MPLSTKLDKQLIAPIDTRLAAVEALNLVEAGDNISLFTNDAVYQNATQVSSAISTAINDLIGSAPGTLDTLEEIATALADDDNAIAALVAQDTAHSTAITALQTKITGNIFFASGSIPGAFIAPIVSGNPLTGKQFLQQGNGLILFHPFANGTSGASFAGLFDNVAIINIDYSNYILASNQELPGQSYYLALANGNDLVLFVLSSGNETSQNTNAIQNINSTLTSQSAAINKIDLRGKIRRLTITADLTLTESDATTQHLINQSGSDHNVTLPASPANDQMYIVVNNSTSTHNLIFAGETVTPNSRHAVQWDGVEWVEM